MSEILARIRVRETHGLRRFLYPLMAEVALPESAEFAAHKPLTRADDIVLDRIGLFTTDGQPVPVQIIHTVGRWLLVDFAVSLAPHEVREYLLKPGMPKIVDDPLKISLKQGEMLLRNRQERFDISCLPDARIAAVIYDGVQHLRGPLSITRRGWVMDEELSPRRSDTTPASVTLRAGAGASLRYKYDNLGANTHVTLTACKSWATVTHRLTVCRPSEEIAFTLPFAAASPVLTYDVGLEGVYGKLDSTKRDAVTWRMEFNEPDVHWTVATNDRIDYKGSTSQEAFQGKRWFHLVDGSKSIAVAITDIPSQCRQITAHLDSDGEIQVAFEMSREARGDAEFGVCYHFLNDAPAIAAATNPQSILLPPTVEILPA